MEIVNYIIVTICRVVITPWLWVVVTYKWLEATYKGEKLNIIVGEPDVPPTKGGSPTIDFAAQIKAQGMK